MADASVAHLSEDGATLVLAPASVASFVEAAEAAAAAAAAEAAATSQRRHAGGRALAGGSVLPPAAGEPAPPTDRCALLADYAAGVTEVQRAQQRLAAGAAAAGLLGLTAGAAPGLGVGAGLGAADLAERSQLSTSLHRLLYAESVLGACWGVPRCAVLGACWVRWRLAR